MACLDNKNVLILSLLFYYSGLTLYIFVCSYFGIVNFASH